MAFLTDLDWALLQGCRRWYQAISNICIEMGKAGYGKSDPPLQHLFEAMNAINQAAFNIAGVAASKYIQENEHVQ